ncbi:MAG: PorV/PorQ family protein [Deferribacteres bacterium]|nr:PorV/PorQ family protein [candidate division KSB1 bacterium]MCB9502171.1 PorV/PorQ family protein [Deferribacteres bacterium]
MNLKNIAKKSTFGALVILLYFPAQNLQAQVIGRVGTTASPFLKIGIGGRALAMGEAYTTQAEDITGIYWNPAGLANISKNQALFSHYEYIADLNYDFGAVVIPVEGFGTIGAFVGYLGMPDIERTTIQFPNGTGERVSANSYVVGLSYSRALTDRFTIGSNAKYIQETIWHSKASGIAFDIGVFYRAFFRNLKIGMSITNFGTEMQMQGRDMLIQHDINDTFEGNNENIGGHLDADHFPLPILFRVGLSSNIAKDFLGAENHDWIVAIDAVHPNDNKEYLSAGTELRLYEMFSLRGGYRQLYLEDSEGGPTFGFGLYFKTMGTEMNLDYANVDYGRLDKQNKFSIILSF